MNNENLTPEKEYDKRSKLKNFKTIVADAVKTLLKPLDADSVKDQAVRQLGVASELVRLGEAGKKTAKSTLKALGVIGETYATGSETVFDSERYRVTAETKTASTRVDESLIDGALRAEGVSGAGILRIRKAITVTSKAATSFKVEAK